MSEQPGFQLQLLGGFRLRSLRHPDRVIAVSAKKARTLLAYVAMQEPMQLSRDRLATLLWPERIDRQARQNLRQCIASLRQDLAGFADELLMIDAETVGLRAVVAVDARQLQKVANADAPADLEAAAALYRGEFLSGLETPGEELGAWAAAERAQLESIAGAILSKAASLADQASDGAKAVQLSARLIALDALREDWHRLVLKISARHLGRDQALLQAKKFIALLRAELDVEPEPETVTLIEQIKAGAIASLRSRSVAIGDTPCHASPAACDDRPAAVPSAPQKVAAGGRAMIASAAVAAAVALLVASLSAAIGPGARIGSLGPGFVGAAIDRSSVPVLVLPFQSEAAATADLARELTENLLTSMTRFSGLTVFDGRSIGGAHDAAAEAAGRFGIRFAAWGSVRRQGPALRLNVGLSDASNHTLAWADDITASDDRIAALATELPKRFARDFQVQAAYAQARGLDGAALSHAAMNALIAKALTIQYRGSKRDDHTSAAALYQEVLRRDPASPLALIGRAAELVTARSNLWQDKSASLAQAEDLIRQALQINPRIERAYYWLGNIYLGRRRRELALQSFDHALELNPSFIPAEAHAGYTLVLLGRTAEGLGRIETALRASSDDPNVPVWLRFAGIAELDLGNDRQAIASLLAAASLVAPPPPLYAALASAYALNGQLGESREQVRLMKQVADPAALDRLLSAAARDDGAHSSRYWQGLRLAANNTL